jgi:hypothetical protein
MECVGLGRMDDDRIEGAKRIMGALVRQLPKPHDKMKIGRLSRKRSSRRPSKSKVAKPGR